MTHKHEWDTYHMKQIYDGKETYTWEKQLIENSILDIDRYQDVVGYKHDPFDLLEVLNRLVGAINMDMNDTERKDMPDLFSVEKHNPYNFQVQEYSQLPENLAIELLADSDALDISEVPINVINDWLLQEKELWYFTDKVVYE